jgi:hypothetical protein
MITLNLLPREQRRQLKKDIRNIELVNNMVLITIVVALTSAIFFAAHLYLDYKTAEVEKVSPADIESSVVGKINSEIVRVEVLQRDYVKWSRVLSNYLSLVPEGNKIYNLNFNKTELTMVMTGFSETRSDFLMLEENLKNSDILSDLDSPISNLLHQSDITYTLRANLKL